MLYNYCYIVGMILRIKDDHHRLKKNQMHTETSG